MKTNQHKFVFFNKTAIKCTGQMLWNDGALAHSVDWLGVVCGKTGNDA